MLVRNQDRYTDKWGYLDEAGKNVIDCIFDEATEFQGTHALTLWKGKWRIIDKSGKEVVVFLNSYSSMSFLCKGLIRVGRNQGIEPEEVKKGVINYKEEVIVDCKYQYIGTYCGFLICNNVISRKVEVIEEMEYVGCEVESTIFTVDGERIKGPEIIKDSVEFRLEGLQLSTVCDAKFVKEAIGSGLYKRSY